MSSLGPSLPASSPNVRTTPPDASSDGDDRWFTHEIHAHDSQLKAYLRNSFPAVRDVDDVVQESYLRIWRKRTAAPIKSAKAFLFTVARRVALDLIRANRKSPVAGVGDLSALRVLDDGPGVAEMVSLNEKIDLLVASLVVLPPRCREVVVLRKLKQFSQKETAGLLNLSEKTVDEQLARGLRRLEEHLRSQGIEGYFDL